MLIVLHLMQLTGSKFQLSINLLEAYHLSDLLQNKTELYVDGFREMEDRSCETVVSSSLKQLREQRILVWVSLHAYKQYMMRWI